MSDETQMNHELESFEASLREVSTPAAKVDRDQLMYDAGWAAAMAEKNPSSIIEKSTPALKSNRFGSIVLSFASGLAVATAVMLSFIPTSPVSSVENSVAAKTDDQEIRQPIAAPNSDLALAPEESPDLIDWIDQLPANQPLNARFPTEQSTEQLAEVDYGDDLSPNVPSRPATAQRLLQEFIPGSVPRSTMPAWAAFMIPGK